MVRKQPTTSDTADATSTAGTADTTGTAGTADTAGTAGTADTTGTAGTTSTADTSATTESSPVSLVSLGTPIQIEYTVSHFSGNRVILRPMTTAFNGLYGTDSMVTVALSWELLQEFETAGMGATYSMVLLRRPGLPQTATATQTTQTTPVEPVTPPAPFMHTGSETFTPGGHTAPTSTETSSKNAEGSNGGEQANQGE